MFKLGLKALAITLLALIPLLLSSSAIAENNSLVTILEPKASVEKVVTGLQFAEGPAWSSQGYMIVSDVKGDTVYKLTQNSKLKPIRKPSNFTNGHAWDNSGRLISAEHASRQVTRTRRDGLVTILANAYNGKRFNSPNDVVVDAKGFIYFTDPPFGLTPPYGPWTQTAELDFSGVYRLDPKSGQVTLLTRELKYPNGITFSPDETKLYVSDSATGKIMVFDVTKDRLLENGSVFANLSEANSQAVVDGMKTDAKGNIYVAGPGGVSVLDPSGKLLGKIAIPEQPTDVAWGDADHKTLYIAAQTSIYRIPTQMTGVGSGLLESKAK